MSECVHDGLVEPQAVVDDDHIVGDGLRRHRVPAAVTLGPSAAEFAAEGRGLPIVEGSTVRNQPGWGDGGIENVKPGFERAKFILSGAVGKPTHHRRLFSAVCDLQTEIGDEKSGWVDSLDFDEQRFEDSVPREHFFWLGS